MMMIRGIVLSFVILSMTALFVPANGQATSHTEAAPKSTAKSAPKSTPKSSSGTNATLNIVNNSDVELTFKLNSGDSTYAEMTSFSVAANGTGTGTLSLSSSAEFCADPLVSCDIMSAHIDVYYGSGPTESFYLKIELELEENFCSQCASAEALFTTCWDAGAHTGDGTDKYKVSKISHGNSCSSTSDEPSWGDDITYTITIEDSSSQASGKDKKQPAGDGASTGSEAQLGQLRTENAELKKIVADQALQIRELKDAAEKSP